MKIHILEFWNFGIYEFSYIHYHLISSVEHIGTCQFQVDSLLILFYNYRLCREVCDLTGDKCRTQILYAQE